MDAVVAGGVGEADLAELQFTEVRHHAVPHLEDAFVLVADHIDEVQHVVLPVPRGVHAQDRVGVFCGLVNFAPKIVGLQDVGIVDYEEFFRYVRSFIVGFPCKCADCPARC
jgi:hypothetical protein